jgi:hypothetical protein
MPVEVPMQRLVEQPSGDGELFDGTTSLGPAHYHLSVYQHFADVASESVPANVEVEGRVRPRVLDITAWHRRGAELTLRLSDGRALDFSFIDDEGRLRSTGRQLYQP